MKKRVLAAVIAAVFAVLNVASALPVFALNESTTRYPTPEGYNDNDYQKLVAFLEQTDDEGVKNGEKLSDNYDPNDPATWGTYWNGQRFQWIESDGELRIQIIYGESCGLCGLLDVSGCTALEELWCSSNNLTTLDVSNNTALQTLYCDFNNLTTLDVSSNNALVYLYCGSNNLTTLDVSGCTALMTLWCSYNNLTTLDESDCTALTYLSCHDNNLTTLDVSGCTALEDLDCDGNNLTELDVSGCTALGNLDCQDTHLTELDLSNNTKLPIDRIYTEGKGYIGYYRNFNYNFTWLYAVPQDRESFLGWYNEDGELLSTDAEWSINGRTEKVFIAKFTGGEPEIIPGDVDGDGELTFNDVTVLYYYLLNGDMTGMTLENLASGDLNNDGVISVSDITLMYNLLLGGN